MSSHWYFFLSSFLLVKQRLGWHQQYVDKIEIERHLLFLFFLFQFKNQRIFIMIYDKWAQWAQSEKNITIDLKKDTLILIASIYCESWVDSLTLTAFLIPSLSLFFYMVTKIYKLSSNNDNLLYAFIVKIDIIYWKKHSNTSFQYFDRFPSKHFVKNIWAAKLKTKLMVLPAPSKWENQFSIKFSPKPLTCNSYRLQNWLC